MCEVYLGGSSWLSQHLQGDQQPEQTPFRAWGFALAKVAL